MSKQSKNQANAAKAVAKSEKKTGAERTTLEVIADIRHNLGSGRAVTPEDQRFLLTQYDDVHALMNQIMELLKSANDSFAELYAFIDSAAANDNLKNAQIAELKVQVALLTAKNEEFRDVYEQENRNQTLRVDVVEIGPGECGTLTEPANV